MARRLKALLARPLRTIVLLIGAWAAGLAAYAAAIGAVRGEVLPLDTWYVIGTTTLVAWLIGSSVVTLPVLRSLAARRFGPGTVPSLPVVGASLAVVPVWLTIGLWYGWHPRDLLVGEAGFLGVHYAASGLVLGHWLGRVLPPEGR